MRRAALPARSLGSRVALVALIALVAPVACGDDAEPAADDPEPRVETHPPHAPPQKAPPRPEQPDVTIAAAAEGGTVVSDRGAAGGRVTVREGARAWLSGMAPFEIVLARGEAHAVVPPAGNVERPELRIGTPSGTVVVGGSSELVVRVAPDGRAWLAVLTGLAHVETGTSSEGGIARTEVTAGSAARIGPDAVTLSEGPSRLDEVSAAADRGLGEGSERAIEPEDAERAISGLRQALAAIEAQATEGRRLADAQRAAEPEEARALQRRIVEHTQRMRELRRALLVHWERARATAGAAHEVGPEDLRAQRPAVATALGLDAAAEERGIP